MTQSVGAALARKLSVSQEEQSDRPRSVLRALRLGFARAAGDRLNLPLSVIGAKQSCRGPEALRDTVGDDWLLLQFTDAEGMSAAFCMDLEAVSAIVQAQTIGEVLPEQPTARAFTDTDAAMVAPLAEDALSRAVQLVDAPEDQSNLSGYEFASRLADLRTLSFAMVEDSYRVFALTVELGGGLRQGQVAVFLPLRQQDCSDTCDTQGQTGPNLEQASGVMRAELNTVICRMSVPLTALSGLRSGDVLPLTGSRLDRAEVLTIDRTRAAVGRLGQCGGMRAVRLNGYTSMLPLAAVDSQEFLEARAGKVQPDTPDLPTQADAGLGTALPDPNPPIDVESELNFADSDQMVAEITQLAGLTNLDED